MTQPPIGPVNPPEGFDFWFLCLLFVAAVSPPRVCSGPWRRPAAAMAAIGLVATPAASVPWLSLQPTPRGTTCLKFEPGLERLLRLGCPSSSWEDAVAEVPRQGPVVMVNIGANKGYNIAAFLALWTQTPGLSVSAWQDAIVKYAKRYKKGALLSMNFIRCGVCGACSRRKPPKHSRSGGVAHAIELQSANRDLIRNASETTGVAQLVRVHDFAASNQTKEMRFVADKVNSQAGRESTQLCTGKCAGPSKQTKSIQAKTYDDFARDEGIDQAFLVSMDVEGFDPLVIEGMRKSIEARRIALFEFETHSKGYWKHESRSGAPPDEQRALGPILKWVEAAGYECFWQSVGGRLVPASGECWSPGMEQMGWANVLCAHEPAVLARLRAPDLAFRDGAHFVEAWEAAPSHPGGDIAKAVNALRNASHRLLRRGKA